jgi:exopolyphosphatase/pppGpp-phosphohydrolase
MAGFLGLGIGLAAYRIPDGASAAQPAPQRLGKYGGIEIGSTGVKSLVVEFIPSDANGYDFKEPVVDTQNTQLSEVIGDPPQFDPDRLEATRNALKTFLTTMRDKNGVAPDRIFVVASSGVFARFGANQDARDKARATLTKTVKDATGLTPAFLDSAEEGTLAVRAIIPHPEMSQSLLFDVGGGNTNGGYFDDKEVFHSLALKYGTRSFHALVKDEEKRSATSFAEAAKKLRETVLTQELHEIGAREPAAARRPRVHLIGGIVWAMTTYRHPAEQTDPQATRVRLAPEDFDRFVEMVGAGTPEALRDQLAVGTNKEAIRKEVEAVQKVFNPEQLLAGAQLLKALAEEYRLRDKDKQLVFFRNGQVAWMMGYLEKQARLDEK